MACFLLKCLDPVTSFRTCFAASIGAWIVSRRKIFHEEATSLRSEVSFRKRSERSDRLRNGVTELGFYSLYAQELNFSSLPRTECLHAAHFALGRSAQARALALEFCDELSPDLKYRDAYMARRLRKLWEENPSADFVYVGGWGHLLDDPLKRTLYSKIKEDLKPRRRLLH